MIKLLNPKVPAFVMTATAAEQQRESLPAQTKPKENSPSKSESPASNSSEELYAEQPEEPLGHKRVRFNFDGEGSFSLLHLSEEIAITQAIPELLPEHIQPTQVSHTQEHPLDRGFEFSATESGSSQTMVGTSSPGSDSHSDPQVERGSEVAVSSPSEYVTTFTQVRTMIVGKALQIKQTIREPHHFLDNERRLEEISQIIEAYGGYVEKYEHHNHTVTREYNQQLGAANARIQAQSEGYRNAQRQITEYELAQIELRQQIQAQKEQLEAQKEQLDGKRALWLNANPGSSARRDAMQSTIRDPFISPTNQHKEKYVSASALGKMPLSAALTQLNLKSNESSLRGRNPYQTTMSHLGSNPYSHPGINATQYGDNSPGRKSTQVSSHYGLGSMSGYGASYTSPRASMTDVFSASSSFMPPQMSSTFGAYLATPSQPTTTTSLILKDDPNVLAKQLKLEISSLYDLIMTWVNKFANKPNPVGDRKVASSDGELWAYMLNTTYPGNLQDSYSHTVALLSDPNTRPSFMARLVVQYCIKKIMDIEAFKPYSSTVAAAIDQMISKLNERGLNNEARQKHIDRGTEAVRYVLSAEDYEEFRNKQLEHHSLQLRDILGPLLNLDTARGQAGKDIGAITIFAWDLSCLMHQQGYTYQMYFPECAAKFVKATMISLDRKNVDPMQLQIRQARVKLVVTPVITMRDDKGTTIRANEIHSATVLLMT